MKNSRFYFPIINAFIFVTSAIAIPVTLTVGSRAARLDGNTGFAYWQHIATFTILSNIFLAGVALAAVIIWFKTKDHKKLPSTFLVWYLSASSAAMVTCLTVLLFLAPMRAIGGKDYFDMLLEPMFFLHFLNPILSAITFIFLTGHQILPKKSRFLATIPIVIYAIPYCLNVIFLHTWPDFYGITFGGKYYLTPIVFMVFWLSIFSIDNLLLFFRHKSCHKNLQ
jgi:hypothetical protein